LLPAATPGKVSTMKLTPATPQRLIGQLVAAAQNAVEVARFGGLDTGEERTPYEVAAEGPVYRLRHYFPEAAADRPAVLLVPPLMLAADVYDVSPAASAVQSLHEHGADPWVVDFGAPEREEGGLERTLADHVLAVSDAVERVGKATGRAVHLAGYSQGGMFCYQAAAYRRGEGLGSVVTFGSPVDTRKVIPFGLPEDAVVKAIGFLAENVLGRFSLPAWASRTGFRLLDPVKSLRSRVDFVRQLHDREALLPREGQRRFLEVEGWVAWPGPALAELMRQFVVHNRMLFGGFVIDGRLVTLADIALPVLCFVGEVDEIAPPGAVRAVRQAAPGASIYEVGLSAGHFGLVVGSTAGRSTWPTVAAWAQWCDGMGALPAGIGPMSEEPESPSSPGTGTVARIANLASLAAGTGAGAVRGASTAASRSARRLSRTVMKAVDQLPRLNRLESAGPTTRISLGLLLDEQAGKTPDATFFLFEGRGYSHRDAKRRIDNVVRGVIHAGVRQGEHVGVLMGTRPSALAVIAALNRIGAVAVLLRPGGSPEREMELGKVQRVVADPEHAGVASALTAHVLVLGGGGRRLRRPATGAGAPSRIAMSRQAKSHEHGEARELASWLTDLERIDPEAVTLPAWYRPNPGRGRDLAFILFTGRGEGTRMNRITNRRFVLSAFGTASAAALSGADTVYGITPIHHPSGLLTCFGGAVAGGARLALAAGIDTSNLWEEVRRYGVTIVPYTWTSLRPLVNAPRSPAEQGHPVRLFVGSGMPAGLWRRVLERFPPARVLEFYASTEGEAVLANLAGTKVGAMGRPLPGSAEVAIAAYDLDAGQLVPGPDGFARRCHRGEVGMLLARARSGPGGSRGTPLRSVFRRDDAWEVTGDLFLRDQDGDFWLVDHAADVIHTGSGAVPSIPIENALGALDAVDLAVAYGAPSEEGGEEPVAAVTLREGHELDGAELARALEELEPAGRPVDVMVVEDIPVTTWGRPVKSALKNSSLPGSSPGSTMPT
jgi:putative long chain acyl-CoA synthase